MKNAVCKSAVAVLFLLFAVTTFTAAQTLERGAIHGTVLDNTKSAIAAAKVTLVSPATGLRRELTSNAEGYYDFEAVAPGTYSVVVEAAGFATKTIKDVVVNVGSSLSLDVDMVLKSAQESITVTAEAAGVVDTSTAGVSQLLDERSVQNLPLEGRDYRDLAQLSPSAQVVPGLRGGIRLGGQQSDYAGLVIDGADSTNNFFGENFGSLETKNLTVPLESVQEFQVVTNGFAPEFGRATGGLLNVVTKSGTNELHGEAHEYYRGGSLTADDALHNPSNIDRQNQFGGSIGFPIHKDHQWLFLSTDIQREHGPLQTVFCPPTAANFAACEASLQSTGPVIGPAVLGTTDVLPGTCTSAAGQNLLPACFGVPNLAAFEGTNIQFQNFFTLLGHYDYQINANNHFSVRGIGTRNHTRGFTGGQGQTETFDAFGNSEDFINQGITGVFSLTTLLGRKVNEARVSINGETRKRKPIQPGVPEISINSIGNFGQRFYLPGNNDNGKLQAQDNFSYSFGKHDTKFGGDVNTFVDRKDIFAGWSAGEYVFSTVCDFDPGPVATHPWCANYTVNGAPAPIPSAPNSSFFFQGLGLNGKDPFTANELKPAYQTGVGLYWQDKWQITPRLTLTYGLRWDATKNPQPQSKIVGDTVLVGQGSGSHAVPVPQKVPNDLSQWGPRVGIAWNVGGTAHPTIVRAAWGLYYAQTPTIFFPTGGGQNSATVFCPGQFFIFCAPESGFPYFFPSAANFGAADLCNEAPGCPSPTYVDPKFRNPRVSNLTAGVEHTLVAGWNVSATYVFAHSEHLRIGGFSTTNWNRNVTVSGTDSLGRSIITGVLDDTTFANTELASFGHGNYHEVVVGVDRKFANRFQLQAHYTWSRNYANASSERDTDTFFGPQDPINLNLDYGKTGLDITHQFKASGVVFLPLGFTWSTSIIAHSGLAYPAYVLVDLNGDGVSNQGIGTNDRPTVQLGSGKPFLLTDYPGRQPGFFNWDMNISKDFKFSERYSVRLSAQLFNITNASNLYSSPDNNAFVSLNNCVKNAVGLGTTCDPLTALPKPGDPTPVGTTYRRLDQLSPGSTPFAAQFGVRFQF